MKMYSIHDTLLENNVSGSVSRFCSCDHQILVLQSYDLEISYDFL